MKTKSSRFSQFVLVSAMLVLLACNLLQAPQQPIETAAAPGLESEGLGRPRSRHGCAARCRGTPRRGQWSTMTIGSSASEPSICAL